jgi:hypothetical protein
MEKRVPFFPSGSECTEIDHPWYLHEILPFHCLLCPFLKRYRVKPVRFGITWFFKTY